MAGVWSDACSGASFDRNVWERAAQAAITDNCAFRSEILRNGNCLLETANYTPTTRLVDSTSRWTSLQVRPGVTVYFTPRIKYPPGNRRLVKRHRNADRS